MGSSHIFGPKGSLPVPQKGSRKFWCQEILILFFSLSSVFAKSSPTGLTSVKKIPFSGYSEGIDFHGGYLWSALPNVMRKIDPKSGEVLETFAPPTSYSESLTWWGKELWNVSYADNGIYRGQPGAMKRVGSTPEVHAWGIAHDGKSLILTGDHGSNKLYFINPKSLKTERILTVEVSDLEDLAWDGKGIWTSSFTAHRGKIFRVDAKSGKIQGVFDIPEPEMCPVVDGIAVEGEFLWIVGKHCPSIYKVKNPLLSK